MATTPATQASIYSGPTAKFSAYDEYLKQLKQKQAAEPAPLTQATEFYQKAISGGTPATQAALEAGRSALSRQATNQRAQAAQAVAGAGQLGQGTAGRSMQQAENKIAETLAASRLNEAQIVGGQQENAVKSLVSLQNLQDDTGWKQYQALAASANPADQAAAAKWLAENSARAGFQRPENASEMSSAALQAAQNDPAYIASQAQQQMEAKKQTALLNASNLTGADKAKALYSAGLTEEAEAATGSLPSLSAGTPSGSIVNSGGVPVRVTSNNVRRVSRGGVSGFFGQTDKIREIYGVNLYTGERVLLLRDNLSA
jgi:hypothetical protein